MSMTHEIERRLQGAILAFAIFAGIYTLSATTEPASLEVGFLDPPSYAKPQTWYHLMNGNVTKEGITRDFEEIAKAGLGGVQIFDVGCDIPPGDLKFGTQEWFDMLRHAHNEAKRLGLTLGIHNCSGWSCSGGPWNKPADAMKVTMHSEIVVTGPSRVSKKLPRIKKDNGFYADIAVLAYPTPEPGATLSAAAEKTGRIRKGAGQSFVRDTKEFPAAKMIAKDKIIDLTAKMAKDGTLTWDVPAGKWSILRLGYICNGKCNHPASENGVGLEVDKFSAEALDRHFDAYVGRLCKELGLGGPRSVAASDGTKPVPPTFGLNSIHVDSWEVGCQNWTHGLEKTFEKRLGYSMVTYLPILVGRVVGSVDESERFCEDFRRLLADLLAENYGSRMAKRCHEFGLEFSAEPYGPSNADDMQYGEVVDVPMSCFWMDGSCGPGKFPCMDNSHYAASLAHVWGRRFVADEAFTSGPPNGGRWLETPFSIKWQNDRAFAKGCNLIVYHRFTHQPWADDKYLPGMTMGRWGMHLDRTQTWWPLVGGWFRYQARCQWMLQNGGFVGDALFWGGEAAPKHGWPQIDLPKGYDYDVCATRTVELLKVKNGKIVVPGGVEYEFLVLPNTDTMSEKMVRRIGELLDAGARVVAQRRPVRAQGLVGRAVAPRPPTDGTGCRPYQALVDSVWAKGVMECEPKDALKRIGVEPDFSCGIDDVAWIHRRGVAATGGTGFQPVHGGCDWYFVACGSATNVSFEASFRIAGRVPEIWDAEKGTIRDADRWRVENGRTVVALDFPPSGSAFVVFRRAATTAPAPSRRVEDKAPYQTVTGPWKVSFPVDWYTGGNAVKTFTWPELKDWTTDGDSDVKYFSGTATYKLESWKVRKLESREVGKLEGGKVGKSGSRIILDLGVVKDFAEVTVNGRKYPPLWRPPFRIDITDAVDGMKPVPPGVINLEIRVTNLWPNRLIGDDLLYPADCEWELRWHNWQKLNEPGIKEIPQWVKDGKPSPTGRHTFTTWKHWTKNDKPLSSGLLGPVSVQFAEATTQRVPVASQDPLSLWTDSAPAKTALVEYVTSVIRPDSPDFIPQERRIAVFDLDGTLICETAKTYIDWHLFEYRVLDDRDFHPTQEQLTAARNSREKDILPALDKNRERMMSEVYRGLTPDMLFEYVRRFMDEPHPGFVGMKRGDAFYKPMLQVVNYLIENGFIVYVCSGTDRFVVRALTHGTLPIPPRQIIGSDSAVVASSQNGADGLDYIYGKGDEPILEGRFIIKNLQMNKVCSIVREIGVQPVLAFGNSMGDASMLNYALVGNRYKALSFMLLCDDLEREYGNMAKADKVRKASAESGWIPVSMRDDWKTIYGNGVQKVRDGGR